MLERTVAQKLFPKWELRHELLAGLTWNPPDDLCNCYIQFYQYTQRSLEVFKKAVGMTSGDTV